MPTSSGKQDDSYLKRRNERIIHDTAKTMYLMNKKVTLEENNVAMKVEITQEELIKDNHVNNSWPSGR